PKCVRMKSPPDRILIPTSEHTQTNTLRDGPGRMTDLSRKRRGTAQVTGDELARVPGVSQSTISRAFTVSASIAKETRARVMEAATALGYQPNVIARSLITRRTNIVAIVMENLTDPFY